MIHGALQKVVKQVKIGAPQKAMEETLGVIRKIIERMPKILKKLLLVTPGETKLKIKQEHGALQINNKVKK